MSGNAKKSKLSLENQNLRIELSLTKCKLGILCNWIQEEIGSRTGSHKVPTDKHKIIPIFRDIPKQILGIVYDFNSNDEQDNDSENGNETSSDTEIAGGENIELELELFYNNQDQGTFEESRSSLYTCDKCPSSFMDPVALERHEMGHCWVVLEKLQLEENTLGQVLSQKTAGVALAHGVPVRIPSSAENTNDNDDKDKEQEIPAKRSRVQTGLQLNTPVEPSAPSVVPRTFHLQQPRLLLNSSRLGQSTRISCAGTFYCPHCGDNGAEFTQIRHLLQHKANHHPQIYKFELLSDKLTRKELVYTCPNPNGKCRYLEVFTDKQSCEAHIQKSYPNENLIPKPIFQETKPFRVSSLEERQFQLKRSKKAIERPQLECFICSFLILDGGMDFYLEHLNSVHKFNALILLPNPHELLVLPPRRSECICSYCAIPFMPIKKLLQHVKHFHPEKFQSEFLLDIRPDLIIESIKIFQTCQPCGLYFPDELVLDAHNKELHFYQCTELNCGRYFQTFGSYKLHASKCQPQPSYQVETKSKGLSDNEKNVLLKFHTEFFQGPKAARALFTQK